MTRRLFNLLTLLSLLLCVAVVALWVRSYWRGESAMALQGHHMVGASSSYGSLALAWNFHPERFEPRFESQSSAMTPGDGPYIRSLWALAARSAVDRDRVLHRTLTLPHWLVAIATLALPLARVARARRRALRTRLGTCPSCGYALRATPDRCPECRGIATG